MSETDTAALAHASAGHDHSHPTPRQYWIIALILAVLTAIEVGLSYIEGLRGLVLSTLVLFGALKFFIVAGWFMHLRFDLRLYSRFFLMGIVGTIVLFAVVLATFQAL